MKRTLLLIFLVTGARHAVANLIDPNTIIDGWIDSIGPVDARGAVTSVIINDVLTDIGEKKHTYTATFAGNGAYRIEAAGVSDAHVYACDGKFSWEKAESLGFGSSTIPEVLEIHRLHNPFYPLALRGWFTSAEWASDETYDGRNCHSYKMQPKGQAAGEEIWTVEVDTGRVRRISTGVGDKRRSLSFDDYRSLTFKGTLEITLPYRVTAGFGEKKVVIQRTAIQVAGAQPASAFAPSSVDLIDSEKITAVLDRYALLGRSVAQAEGLHSRKLVETISTAATGISTHRTVTLKRMPTQLLIDDVTVGMGETLEGFDGKAGWELSDILGYRPLKTAETYQLFSGLFPEADKGLLNAAPLRRLIGERIVDEKRTIAIGLANPYTALGVYYFDAEDGHLLRVALSKKPYARVPDTTIDYADYKPVDGVDLAFTTIVTSAATQSVISIDSIDNNVDVEDALFAPRKRFARPVQSKDIAKP